MNSVVNGGTGGNNIIMAAATKQ